MGLIAGTLCLAALLAIGVAAGIEHGQRAVSRPVAIQVAPDPGVNAARSQPARQPTILALPMLHPSVPGADHASNHDLKGGPRTASAQSQSERNHPMAPVLMAGRPTAPAVDRVTEQTALPAPPAKTEHFRFEHPVSITTFLREAGLDFAQQTAWSEAFRSSAHSPVLRPGHDVAVLKDPKNGQLRGFRYDLDDYTSVVEQSLGEGVVFASRQPLTYVAHTVTATVPVKPGLEAAARRDHLPPSVLDRVENIFGAHLKWPGAILKLAYREFVTPDGTHHRDADLEAAEVTAGSTQFQAFNFRDGHGREHLYDANGHQLGPQFLRYPVKFSYISSTFSEARYHPILHIFRPHVGVDLAARYGTPVKAAGDGVVEFAGWDGELGRCIKIQHPNDLVSVYGHLSGVAAAVKPGAAVRLGQVIGYVGATGLATGPHLHYALYKEGHFLNPLTAKLDEAAAIPSDQMADFDGFKDHWESILARLPDVSTAPRENAPGTVLTWGETPDSQMPAGFADVQAVSLGASTAHGRHQRHLRHRLHTRHEHRLATGDGQANGTDAGSM